MRRSVVVAVGVQEMAMRIEPGDWVTAGRRGFVGVRRPGHRLVTVRRRGQKPHIRWDDGREVEFVERG